MPRPARHDHDSLLDRAVVLVAGAGPEAATMAEVGRAAGAPSGSVYHRFPNRSALLAALWLRTVGRLQDDCLAAVAAADPSGDDPVAAAVALARRIVGWSRSHPDEAHVLLHGAAALGLERWSPADRDRAAARRAEVDRLLRRLARGLGLRGPVQGEPLLLAVVDLPYALVRRHLRAGTPIPPGSEELVERAVRALIGGDG